MSLGSGDGNAAAEGVHLGELSIARADENGAGAARGERMMSFAQQRLWFLEHVGSVRDAYRILRWMHLEGPLDRTALARALDRLVQRHGALRTTFHAVDGHPVQRVHPAAESRFLLREHDLRDHPDPDGERDRVMAEAAAEPFDLERGPLIRGRLLRLPEARWTLAISVHHIVCDGWSMSVFDHDLGKVYGAFQRGEDDPLPPLPVQYADYAAWQRGWLAGEVLERQAAYWRETLAGAPKLLEVPADRPRPAQHDHTAAEVPLLLDDGLARGLKALGQRHGTTPFMTLLAGWATVLSRLTGQDDVVVGTPTAGRRKREITGLVGFFVNTLALRLDLSGAPTVAELLGRVKAQAAAAHRHQDIPFEQVVDLVQPERSLAHAPLFQVMFTWQNAFRRELALPGLTLRSAGWALPRTAMFDLTLSLQEADEGIAGGIGYATALFDHATVARYAGYLRRVLEGMVADDALPVDRLPMLPGDERALVVHGWNATDAAYPDDACVHERFEAQARRAPDAVAVVSETETLTYAALNARANRLAHHLRARGVGPDARVGLCVERGPEMVAGLLAVLKAGGAYVPLDPAYPVERLREMLADAGAAALLTRGPLAARFDGLGVPVIDLAADAPAWAALPESDPPRGALTPDHLAYVIYTSGSTGRPKGVINQHRCLVNRLAWGQRAWALGAGEAVLGQTSLSFDGHVRELLWPLTVGARVVLARPEGHRDPAYLLETIRREGVTTLNLVPSLLQALLEQPEVDGLAGLTRVLCGGEALPTPLLRRFRERLPAVGFHNLYGPSEAATAVAAVDCAPDDARAVVPIGRPTGNARTYVLDGRGEPVPVGVAGELCVGGVGVARGYLDRPSLTAERFVPDPFSAVAGARMYRTGDRARWLGDGTIEFLGRSDFQVKVRGYRIEPGEIEARLAEHPGVREAVVVVRGDARGDGRDPRLVAYVVPAEAGRALEVGALRAHLAERLPAYMVPAAYVPLDALPLTPNGKLDRKALPAPEGDAFATRAYTPPAGETEAALAEIWLEVLGVERVGRDDHFFALGGHSLLAVTLVERMRRRGLHADVRALFTAPTLAELAASVEAPRDDADVPQNAIPAGCRAITPEMLPLVRLDRAAVDRIVAGVAGGAANVQDVYPLAPLQEGVLFHHLLAAEGDPYLLSILFAVETRARLDAFVAALNAAVARHDVLRTAVAWEGLPEPVQVVWREAPLVLEEVEIDPAGGDVAARLHARFDPRRHRIDVGRAPLMRAYAAWDAAHGRWVLLLLRHHLVSDHTTVELLLAEVEAHLLGRGGDLPPVLPFRAFVARTRRGVSRAEHEAFFTSLLGDVDEPTAPFGLLDARGDGGGIAEAALALGAPLAGRLRERARRLGVSAASLCHVAFARVLARVSGRGDVVFGTLLLGRMQGGEGADRVMGPFINTLPIRVRVDRDGVEASVRGTHALLAALLRHEHASLALAQRCSRVRAPAPLFSALLNYRHSAGLEEGRTSDARRAWEGIRRLAVEERTNYALALSVDDLGDGFRLTAQAPTSVDPARLCAMMRTALERLVSALETAPETPVSALDVMPAEERRRLLEGWNETDAAYPRSASLHALFEAQAARTPGSVAAVHGDRAVTYGQMDGRAARLARRLRAGGVAPGARVAIVLPRSIDLLVAELAILKAGAAYVPIDPSFPAERIAYMAADSGARVVVARAGEAAASLPGVERIDVDLDAPVDLVYDVDGGAGDEDRGGVLPSEAAAYVMYTSGSTGAPKGVVVPHRAVARLVLNNGYADFRPDDRVAFAANPAFDATTMEVWGPLLTGGRVVVLDADVLLEPRALAGALARHGVTVLFLTTAVFNPCAAAIPAALAGLRILLTGGERADPASFARVLREGGPVRVVHCYGPTETTTYALTHPVATVAEDARGVPLGRPISNTRAYLLDADGELVPVGVAGEMSLGGDGVAHGYLGRPALTAERFVPDPFSRQPGARLYRTGDLARWLADGTIEFLGRDDHQVKLRGFRVEPGEIEASLLENPDVREAVVLVREDAPGDRRLAAYVVASEVDAAALRAHLAARLPEHMVPAAYVRLDALPLTPNGKVDRRALPAPGADGVAARAYEAPAGALETALAAVWAGVLGVARVGRRDHFFELGGHSLLAVQAVSRIRAALGMDAALGDLFQHPELADFARTLEAAAPADLPAIVPAERGGPLPLSFAQQRLWFLERLGGLGSTYHVPARLRLRGDLDRAALARALDGIVARHEALRTTFVEVDGEPVQEIAPAETSRFPLLHHDLTAHPAPEAEAVRLAAEEAAAPFDLARRPLIRGRLLRLAADDHVLLVTMHHVVSDGWSVGVMTDELSALYAAFQHGDADPLPPLPLQYADWAAWQRRAMEGDAIRRQADYWAAALAGAPEVLALPTDRPRPPRQDPAGAAVPISLDAALTAGLKGLGQRHGTTLFMTLLAGWAVVLSRLAGETDVVVGTPTANRGRAEIEGLVGFFVNTLALRVDLSGAPTVADLLARVRDRALEAQRHQDVPFEQVVDLVRPARSLAHAPLFQVLFTWQNAPRGTLALPGLTVATVEATAHDTAKFDLSLTLQEADGGIEGTLTYATALFDRATVERWTGHLRRVLAEMAADDARPADRLPILSDDERRRVVEDWNATGAPAPAEVGVHAMFEAQARRTPDAAAVVSEGETETLAYGALNAVANRLAHHLRGLGVGPDARVAVCAERSPEMVVALLATLKAGGAYVPLEPSLPAARMRAMLDDAAPAAVLTHGAIDAESRALLRARGVPVLDVRGDAAAWVGEPEDDPRVPDLAPDHLAYVIYTSGSTGTPKGVMVRHGNLAHYARWAASRYAGEGACTFPLCSSFAFDLTVTALFVPLVTGGAVAVYGEAEGDVPVLRVFDEDRVDAVKLTPSHLALLASRDLRGLRRIRTLVVGGEDLKAPLARAVVEASGGRLEVFNEYGPTEATVGCMIHRFDRARDRDASVPIGVPIANTRIHLLDAAGEPVPVGVVGEMYIGGAGVARGYLNRPALTAERFVADPFSADGDARLYRTGDLARRRADGTIEYLGRNDHQVKVRGFRIEPGEIEARLAEHPGVREAAVVAREDAPGDRRLVAYYAAGETVDAGALRLHLAARLPDHMVPAAFVRLDALPLTPNGKLDRRALPAPGGDAFASRGYEAPSGPVETALAEIWAHVLGVERVGRHDHFFELGGHSLRAVQVVSRVRQVLGADVALGDVFLRPVLADFARGLETASRAALPPIVPVERGGAIPLSFAQQRLWFLQRLEGAGRAYHVPAALRLRGGLDRDALSRALHRIVARHEVLRTTFAEIDGEPVQEIDGEPVQEIAPAGASRFPLLHHDLAAHPQAEEALARLADEEAGAPFDLARGPLIRGRLVRLAAGDHVLLVTMHHVVSDGWSMGVLTDELGALYGAFLRGEPDPLPPLTVQYADYAAWQRRWVDGDVLRGQGEFWRETLAGAPEVLEVAADRPRPARQDFAGAFAALALDEAATASLHALSRRHGTTLFMTLLAGWSVVLSRLSGHDDVVIGTPAANRGRAEIEGLVGFFVNTLALRVDLSGAPTVADLLARVKAGTLAAQQHGDIPFEQVVDLVQPARSLSHAPLFQVMFAWQNTPRAAAALPGLTVEPVVAARHVTAQFDLSLSLHEADGRVVGGVEYATARFDPATVDRYLGHLRRVLAEMAADDARPVHRLAMMGDDERRAVVETWNATDAAPAAGATLHARFEAWAARTPDAVAVVSAAETVTYAALNARANRLAHHLRARGVGPDARVAVCAERGVEMMVGLLGTLKAGGAYVPLDPSYPADRLRFMLADSAPAALLAQGRPAFLDGVALPVIDLAGEAAWAERPATNPESFDGAGDSLAYVIYTSGSTGTPKGVMNGHRGVANLLGWMQEAWPLGEGDAVLQLTSFSFDASVCELFWPLTAGARVVMAPHGAERDPAALVETIRRERVGTINLVPSLLQVLLEEPGVEACPSLARVLCGGEALPPALARRVRERLPRAALHNLYGPTETADTVASWRCGVETAERVPVGRPMANTRLYVLDGAGEPVPVGVAGELYVGGAQVARGYLGRPALTAARFVPDPFAAAPGARLYRTGDVARRRGDGALEFLGRADAQVKVRGHRVEPGEIEARLAEHPSVREAAVVGREDTPGDARLVAYVVVDDAAGGAAFDGEALRRHLAARLPAHMVPAAFVRMAALPQTPSGKRDLRALPAPEGDALERAREAPSGPVETAIAAIWAEVLGVDRVGRHDDFFARGGHSLRAVQVVSRVRRALSVDVALGDLFLRPVLADFARGLETAARADLPAIAPAERDGPLPLSFAQQRLWFLEQMGSGGRAYHIPAALRLRGGLDVGALARALDRVVARHEALRTTFHDIDGRPEQRIASPETSRFHLLHHDLTEDPQAEEALARLASEEAAAPFDLARGPLIRGRLVRLGTDDHALLVTMHHVVSDGWSMEVLIREVRALYAAFLRGEPDPLPPLAVQYADYAAWQRRWMEGDVLEAQAEYWRETLGGAPEVLALPTDRPRPARQDAAGAAVPLALDERETAGLMALGRRHGATPYVTLLAGWATLLARLSGQDDVVVGSPAANRGRAEIEGLIGFFVNTLALRVDLSGSPTVADLLARVRERALEAQRHQDIPFEQVVDLARPARSLSHSPLFQAMFAWQDAAAEAPGLPGVTVEPAAAAPQVTARFDLTLNLCEEDGRIVGAVEYRTSLFDRATVERWIGSLRRVLAAMVADDRQAVHRLPLISASERHRVVTAWNATDAAYPRESSVHARFEALAAHTPDAVAVEHGDVSLSYAALNARANALACALAARGAGAGQRVAILLPRSVDLVVAELATLKAGAAYVPLDPSFPAERIAFLVADSGARVVLCRAGDAVPALPGVARIDVDAAVDGDAGDPGPTVTGEDAAYVMYTSGSTGTPKGVVVPHRAVLRLVLNTGYADFGADDRVAFAANPAFDATTMEVWAPLLNGGRVVVVDQDVVLDAARLRRTLVEREVSVLWLTVGLFNQHADELGDALGRLRYLIVGGDALDPRVIARVLRGHPPRHLVNGYGPTETTTFAVTHEIAAVDDDARGIPLGRPISNTRAYVLDGHGEPVPVGVAGELFLGGDGVAHGYLGRPTLTADRFVPDALSGRPGARLYRTGDRARWLADGTIDFLGRADDQVKVRGFRVEPGEIEARLAEHPAVREAVVVAREDAPGDRRLVAYLVAAGDVDAGALRAHLSSRLPEHMLPAAYVRLDALPLTANGKVDRRALPAPEGDAFSSPGYEAPEGEMETAVAAIWAEVLGVDRVGRHDEFFALGGHSLRAVQVVSRVRRTLAADVALGDLFQRPVLADFARGLETAGRADLPPIVPVERDGPLPLSFAQQRLWFLERLGGLGSTYHVPAALRLRGELGRDALSRALDRIVARHEVLRTTFAEADGEPVQVIAPREASRFPLLHHDLTTHPRPEAELARLADDEADAPFDLARGPLVRGRLVRLAADDHVLLVTMHHVVSDGWSMGVLTGELGALYAAFLRGDADPLPPLAVQYADYAAWQRRGAEGDAIRRQADYWTAALAGAPELLELPTDHARPAHQDFTGDSVEVALGETLTAGLAALSRRHGTTLHMTLLAGWAVVLSRLSGQTDVVVGSPSANRGRPEIEGLIGFFVNTLAMRVDLSGAPTVADLLARVRTRALEAQQHQDVPFEQVVDAVRPARSLAHAALFQAMLAWQNTPEARLDLPGLTVEPVPAAGPPAAKFDLSLHLAERDGRIAGSVTYAAALFERETVERWAGYLRRVLEAMVADDALAVDRLPMLPEEERRLVVETWNATDEAYPAASCLHEMFEAQAARTPDAIAVEFEGRTLTYGALNARANRLAHHLRAMGVGPDARVAIRAERSLEMMVGLLGVLKSGGAYVPLDPSYPADRLRFMLEDSAPAAVLVHGARAAVPEGIDIPVIDLASDAEGWAGRPETNPARGGLTPDHLAYVIYTSGSTGRPKGVTVAHRSVVNVLAWMQETFALRADDVVLQKTPISFDASARELYGAMMAGARLVIARPEGHRDPGYLAETIRRAGVTTVHFVPSMLQLFLEHPAAAGCTGLARVVCGGEALPSSLARRLGEVLPGAALFNVYGPTEATVDVTAWRWTGDAARAHLPIGRPMANTRIYLVDDTGEPVPAGVAGELRVGGVQVARGYLGRPALTAEQFVPDPFSRVPGARLYRTGDRARWLADGAIEYLGRGDLQVKVRGHRIEPGEIEARLAEHPAVRDAVVLARDDASGDRRLVAYCVADALDAESLRAHLAARLPEHMVPAAYVRLDALPLTPNGKLDRRALPAPEDGAYAARDYEAPEGETETALAEVWAEVLGVARVGRGDDFFALGGHSLLAVRVLSRVRQALGVDVPLGELFLRPVLADFARAVDSAARAALPPVVPGARGARVGLSLAQRRLWFLDRLGGAGGAYPVASGLRLRGVLDRAALGRALDAVVRRHESLRTTFTEVDGEPVQRIAAAEGAGWLLVDHDLRGHPDAAAETARLAAEEATAPFDLARGPLVRGRLLRVAEEEHVLLVTMHHIVSDGWSMGIVVDEMSALYAAFRRGEPDPLPPLTVQYADYVAWEERWLGGDVLRGRGEWWRETLAGAPELLALPADRPRPARPDHAGAFAALALDEALTASLRALSRRHGTTLFMTLLAGWATVLSRVSGQDDVVIGTPTANRGRAEIEGLVGFFVNTLALRVDLSGAPTVADLLARVRAGTLAAQQHGDVPFEQVVDLVRPARSLSHAPLFQVFFAWQNTPQGTLALPGLTREPLEAEAQVTARFDLALSLQEADGRIVGGVRYATALFDRATVERHLGHLRRVLAEMAAGEARAVDRLPLLSDDERRLVVETWNATDADLSEGPFVHERFEAWAARTPNAVAVVQGDVSLSYRALNARANRLAHHLRALGVGPDARVAVSMERSPEMLAALLAVLKAGGAYVPLDPEHPADRLRTMLADGAPAAVLTHGAWADRFAGAGVLVVDAAASTPAWADGPETDPGADAVGLHPHHLAYVVHTSGSTGEPKGVMVEHRGVANLLGWAQRFWGLGADEAVMHRISVSFDVSVRELFWPLAVGARVVMPPPGGHNDPDALVDTIAREGVGTVHLVPSLLQVLLEHPRLERCASLARVLCGGEVLPPALARRFHERLPHASLFHMYGPTETTVGVTALRCAADGEGPRIPLGRPMANTRVYVLDAAGAPAPVGVAGEMHVGGAQVARGYLGRAAATAERFLPDPFSATPGARLYRTGDRGRWLPDGTLEFLGRDDAQVKIRGHRVEPGEIEACLAAHPAVREAVVVVREDRPGERALVAYHVASASWAADAEALRAHAAERLPAYMVPSAYVRLDAWPLTPNGKVDRRALPAPDGDAFLSRPYAAPEGETEAALAEVWSALLGVERVGRNDHFFEAGGHSLLATKLVLRIRAEMGVEVALRDVFERPVLSRLAEHVLDLQLADFDPDELARLADSLSGEAG